MAELRQGQYPEQGLRASILHLGTGAFHRAHQAWYLHQLLEQEDSRHWGICAVNLRPQDSAAFAQLAAQQGHYCLKTLSPTGEVDYHWIRSLVELVDGAQRPEAVCQRLADPAYQLVTLTVTEGGYYLDEQGNLDRHQPAVSADLNGGFNSLYGFLYQGLRQRMLAGHGPLTLLSCDNLRHNGARLRRGLSQFIAAKGDQDLLAWVEQQVSFPNSMVDRITPRLDPALSAEVRSLFGREDAQPVQAEAFCQWVVEDNFRGQRPPLERVGVTFTADVLSYEEAKIRLLNGGHMALAYSAALKGYQRVDEAMTDAELVAQLDSYLHEEVIASLPGSPLDLPRYWQSIRARFANPYIVDTVSRLCAEGSSKLPIFVLSTLETLLNQGQVPRRGLQILANWYLCLQRQQQGRLQGSCEDVQLDWLQQLLTGPEPVQRFAHSSELWGSLPSRFPSFSRTLIELIEQGAQA